jgi:hypothetical protein
MGTTLDRAAYDDPRAQLRDLYTSGLDESAAAVLTPTKRLVDASPARKIATKLESAIGDAKALHQEVYAERARVQADRNTRPAVLREQFQQFSGTAQNRANELQRTITSQADELRKALHEEALPSYTDASRELLARQDVEAALRSVKGKSIEAYRAAVALAERPDTASAIASPWGRLSFLEAGGSDETYGVVTAAAIETSLAGPDEGRRRAAAAYKALDAPMKIGGGSSQALYTVGMMATHLMGDAGRAANEMPSIG